jgi:hypothetical protein
MGLLKKIVHDQCLYFLFKVICGATNLKECLISEYRWKTKLKLRNGLFWAFKSPTIAWPPY